MAFIDEVLQEPTYGWQHADGTLVKPTPWQLWREMRSRVNIFKTKRNWISAVSVVLLFCLLIFSYVFFVHFFSVMVLIAAVVYALVIMGTHGTIWFHRYCTHGSFKFSHPIWRVITQNLVIKTISEEVYVVSHHVHHSKSDESGDPYNAQAGLLYCALAEFNHQRISPTLSEENYRKTVHFMKHTGVQINSYDQYLKWGSVASPLATMVSWILNWVFWYSLLFLIGGHGLACAFFSAAIIWFVLVRGFNYSGHGGGKKKHVEGVDFDKSNYSVNQLRPGLFAGEWHNNHHLYPGSARAGFLPYQLDLPWIYVYLLHKIGGVSSFRDSKQDFLRKYVSKNVNASAVSTDSGLTER